MSTATLDSKLKELGFGNREFGCSSVEDLYYLDAVRFAERNGGRLQSLREAVGYRVASDGADGSARWNHTGNSILYFRFNDTTYGLIVDDYDFVDRQGRRLISLTDWRLGVDDIVANFHKAKPGLLLNHFYVDGVDLGFGYDAMVVWFDIQVERGLIPLFTVPDGDLVLPTEKPSEPGEVYFGNHPIVTGLLTSMVADVYSDYLSRNGHNKGCVRFPSEMTLDDIPDGKVVCRPISLNEDGVIILSDNHIDYDKHARVTHTPQISRVG